MFLSPSSPRRIASTAKTASNLLRQRSASGPEIRALPGPISTLGSGVALPSTQTPVQSPRSLSSLPTARYGPRITGVTFTAIHRCLRQARSVLRLGCHHIFLPQVGRHLQRSKTFDIDLDVIFILPVLAVKALTTTVSLRRLFFFPTSSIRGRLYLIDFRIPSLAQGC